MFERVRKNVMHSFRSWPDQRTNEVFDLKTDQAVPREGEEPGKTCRLRRWAAKRLTMDQAQRTKDKGQRPKPMTARIPVMGLVLASSLASFCLAQSESAPDPPSPAGDGTLGALTSIAGQGMMDSRAYQYLEELSDSIGGRVTGSPQAAKAIEWGLAKMKAIGLENVGAERWQLSRGWTRVSAEAELLCPIERRLQVDSLGWVGSTPAGGAEAEVAPVNAYELDREVKENASRW